MKNFLSAMVAAFALYGLSAGPVHAEYIVVQGVRISVAPATGAAQGAKAKASKDRMVRTAPKKTPALAKQTAPSKPAQPTGLRMSDGDDGLPGIFRIFRKDEKGRIADEERRVNRDRDRDVALASTRTSKSGRSDMQPQSVPFSGYKPGTIVINSKARELFFVENRRTATRYRVAVGREGLGFTGETTVGDKQYWPKWFPTKEMQEREPSKYAQYAEGMDGGPANPLGARAIYLYQGKQDTHIRIHGTNNPSSIGTASSNGCFRMLNEHVMELYEKVRMGAPVVVL